MKYDSIYPLGEPSQIFNLKGRIGLIVGGGGKLGHEFAKILLLAGAKVVLSDLSEDVCQRAVENVVRSVGKKPLTVVCDVSDEENIHNLFLKIQKDLGGLDFFISNVMAKPDGYYRPFEEYPIETWKKVHDVNLTGTFLCCREAAKLMAKGKKGSIVITSSIYAMVAPNFKIYKDCSGIQNPYGGQDPLTTPASYASSKGAIVSLGRYLAVLLAPKNIRVNVLTPGGIYDNQEESFHQAYIEHTPLGRMAVWSDYNGAILFLVSDASRYMTGANLVVDGGWTAW